MLENITKKHKRILVTKKRNVIIKIRRRGFMKQKGRKILFLPM